MPTILKPAAFILGLDSKPVDVLEKEKMKSTYVVPKGFLKINFRKKSRSFYILSIFINNLDYFIDPVALLNKKMVFIPFLSKQNRRKWQ